MVEVAVRREAEEASRESIMVDIVSFLT